MHFTARSSGNSPPLLVGRGCIIFGPGRVAQKGHWFLFWWWGYVFFYSILPRSLSLPKTSFFRVTYMCILVSWLPIVTSEGSCSRTGFQNFIQPVKPEPFGIRMQDQLGRRDR